LTEDIEAVGVIKREAWFLEEWFDVFHRVTVFRLSSFPSEGHSRCEGLCPSTQLKQIIVRAFPADADRIIDQIANGVNDPSVASIVAVGVPG
jgi:hypothetical protein